MAEQPDIDWRGEVFARIKAAGTELVAYLPDAGLDSFIKASLADNEIQAVALTTEEEGVGVCCGAWLGGKKSALLIQSSGIGNCINAFSLVTNCQFPFFMLVSMRGEFGEGNPWQVPMGSKVQQHLELAGFHVFRATRSDEVVGLVEGGLNMVARSEQPVAILLSQRLLGAKVM